MRAVVYMVAIAGTALLASCGGGETANLSNATEVAPVENSSISDAMVTSIEANAPIGNESDVVPSNTAAGTVTKPGARPTTKPTAKPIAKPTAKPSATPE
ncbi:MAG: hypothetical protein V4808_03635 [Pseudomonadota bacterium]